MRNIQIKTYKADSAFPFFDDFASLRMRVFREFPYLYEGEWENEVKYLQRYRNAPSFVLFLVFEGSRIVGASSALKLEEEEQNLQYPFISKGIDPTTVFYFGESILLPEYRGLGLGKEFFLRREAEALQYENISLTSFCAVERAENHPARTSEYRPPQRLWSSLGYKKDESLYCMMDWKDVLTNELQKNTLHFWLKEL